MRTILLLLLFCSCAKSQTTTVFPAVVSYYTPPPYVPPWAGKTTYFYGDSWTLGIDASIPANRWTTLFSTGKGTTENNNGISGQSMQASSCGGGFAYSAVATYNASTDAACIIAYGLNDIGQNIAGNTAAGIKTAYQNCLNFVINTRGWAARDIFVINPGWCPDYTAWLGNCSGTVVVPADAARAIAFNTAIQEACADYGVTYVDVYTPMSLALNTTYYNAGKGHLIDNGMLYLANLLLSLIP